MSFTHLAVLLLSFWLAWRLIGWLPALLAFLLIAFDPFHLALSRLLHLDALLANLYLLAILAITAFLFQRRFYDLLIAALAAGLCWLTKSPGFFLLPTAALLFLLDFWFSSRQRPEDPLPAQLWDYAWRFALWGLLAAAAFVLLWPAMWVNPLGVLLEILASAGGYAAEGHSSPIFFNGQVFLGGISGSRLAYFYPLTYLWRTTPVTLLGLLAAAWAFSSKQDLFSRPGVRRTLLGLLIAALVFFLGMNLGSKKFDRYLLPVYAPLNIAAALGWSALALWLKEKLPPLYARLVPAVLLILLVAFQAWSSLSIFPYSMAYYNPLLGGGHSAPRVMQIGWGEGLDQAALYLNQKDGADDLNVFSWYENGPFSFFFEGNSRKIRGEDFTESDWRSLAESDYLVIYIHQWQRNLPAELLEYIKRWKPEHTIWINNMEYVKIYKVPD
jgi:4-amino-4-deoxy-L-arabinose transferase-like glycosyltransferase